MTAADPTGDALEQRAEDSTVIMGMEYALADGDDVDDDAIAHWLRAEIALAEHEDSISFGAEAARWRQIADSLRQLLADLSELE